MEKAKLDRLVELIKQKAWEIGEQQKHGLMVFAITDEQAGVLQMAEVPKDQFTTCLAAILRKLQADAYVIVIEAWMARVEPGGPIPTSVMALPLDDRTEILTLTACENGKSYRTWVAKITSTPHGRRLSPWETVEGTASGRMVLTTW